MVHLHGEDAAIKRNMEGVMNPEQEQLLDIVVGWYVILYRGTYPLDTFWIFCIGIETDRR